MQHEGVRGYIDLVGEFPSPYGEVVSATFGDDSADPLKYLFPSPYGEVVSATALLNFSV